MRDLVETVIGQVMRQDPGNAQPARSQAPSRSFASHLPTVTPDVHHPNGAAGIATPKDNDPLWKASKQFEAMFVEQMLTEMHKTVPKSGMLNKGFADNVQNSMLDQAVAEAVSKQGRMGIASSLYRQLSQHRAAVHDASQAQGTSNIVAQANITNRVNDRPQVNPQVNGLAADKQLTAAPPAQGGTEGDQHGTH